jgi:hypothetical protein
MAKAKRFLIECYNSDDFTDIRWRWIIEMPNQTIVGNQTYYTEEGALTGMNKFIKKYLRNCKVSEVFYNTSSNIGMVL